MHAEKQGETDTISVQQSRIVGNGVEVYDEGVQTMNTTRTRSDWGSPGQTGSTPT